MKTITRFTLTALIITAVSLPMTVSAQMFSLSALAQQLKSIQDQLTSIISLSTRGGQMAQVVPPPAGTMGFLGCSMTLNAVEGYRAQGGSKLWPIQTTNYGGGSIGAWANNLTDQSKYWGTFSTTLASQPTTVFWFELCTSLNQTPSLDTYAGATTVLTELRRRVPGATVYVSAQPAYTDGHVCSIAGATGPATAQSIVDQLVTNGVALRGPVIGPLTAAQTVDGCHATTEGKALMGNQLISAFDVSAPVTDTTAPTTPSNLIASGVSTSQINLSWTASTDAIGVAGYRVYRNGTLLGTTPGVSYQNTGLAAATTYTYTVQAYDAAGNMSAQTASVSATTQSVTTGGSDVGGNRSIIGPITGRTIPFRVTLPPSYTSQTTRRYPVIYHLHGAGARYTSGTALDTVFLSYMNSGQLPEAIIVYPDGNLDSFWANSYDGAVLIETNVIQELVPYIDATYRTIADRDHRVIQGFSMGGFGAMEYAVKFPSLFGIAVGLDGALTVWSDLVFHHPEIALSMFNNSETIFNPYSPYYNAQVNQSTIRSLGTDIFVLVGQLVTDNQNWQNQLNSLGIPYQFHDSTCQHSFSCITGNTADMNALATFLTTSLGSTPAPTPDTTAPSTPTNLSATTISTSQINLSWSASTDAVGVTGYRIYRNGTLLTTTTGTTYSNTGLTAATTYTYTVQAYDAAGNSSAQSASVSATTQSATAPSTKFTLNQRVQTTATLNIRATANGTLLGSQATGALGTIIGGPTYTGGYHWWNVNFDSGVDGWAAEDWMSTYTAPTPTPTTGTAWPYYFSTSRSTLPVWAESLRRTVSVDEALTIIPSSDVILTMGTQVCGALGSGRDQAQVDALMASVSLDGGATYRNCIRTEAVKGVQGQQNNHAIYWHIGNEINSQHYSTTMGTTGRASDQTMIADFVEYFVAPTVQGLDEASAQTGVDTPAILGSIVSGHNADSRAWLDALMNYTIQGTYAPSLAGRRVYEVVDGASLHYTIAASNWEESFNDIAKWIGQGKVRMIIDTEELGSQSMARGAAQFQALQGFVNFTHWVHTRGYTPAQARLNFWAQGDNTPDEAMTIVHTFLGDTTLRNFTSPTLVGQTGTPSAYTVGTTAGDKRLVAVLAGQGMTGGFSSIQIPAEGWTAGSVSGTMYVFQTTTSTNRYTTEPVTATLANGVYTITRSTTLASENAAIILLTSSVAPTPTPTPTITLSATPTALTTGQSITLTWSSANATSCTASNGWSGTKATSGSQVLTPTTTTTYTLSCTGTGGTTIQSVSVAVSSVADTTAPSTPTSLTATTISTSQINLSWSASTDAVGVTGYRIYRNGTLFTTTTGTTYSNTGLTAATTYTYTVQAYDAAGNSSAQSTSVSATTQSSVTTSTKFTLNQRVQTTATLNIRATANGTLLGSQATGALGTIIGGPTYTGGYHWWNVNFDSGVDGWAAEDWMSTYTAPIADTTSPTTPASLSATTISTSQINLSWSASTDAVGVTGYRIYRNGTLLTTTTGTTYSNTGLTAATTYTYTVQAYDAAGNNSAQSTSVSATTQSSVTPTPVPIPTLSFAATPTEVVAGGSTILSWSSTNATSCVASGSWGGTLATTGSQASGNVTAESTYTLSCYGDGGSITQTITVGVTPTTTTPPATDSGAVTGGTTTPATGSGSTGSTTGSGSTTTTGGTTTGGSSSMDTGTIPESGVTKYPALTLTLGLGSTGGEVTTLQQMLAQDPSIYPEGDITGYYGVLTQAAVQRFQAKYNIVSGGSAATTGYGQVGPTTRAQLNALYAGTTTATTSSGLTAEQRALIEAQIRLLQEQVKVLLEQLVKLLAAGA